MKGSNLRDLLTRLWQVCHTTRYLFPQPQCRLQSIGLRGKAPGVVPFHFSPVPKKGESIVDVELGGIGFLEGFYLRRKQGRLIRGPLVDRHPERFATQP